MCQLFQALMGNASDNFEIVIRRKNRTQRVAITADEIEVMLEVLEKRAEEDDSPLPRK